MESTVIDATDRRILDELGRDGRISWRDLSDRIHLAPTSVAERVRRLEQRGVIRGYSVDIDPVVVGRDVRAVVDVSLVPGDMADAFERRLAQRDEVVMAAYVTGSADYAVFAECAGPAGLDAFVRWLRADEAIARTETKMILRAIVG